MTCEAYIHRTPSIISAILYSLFWLHFPQADIECMVEMYTADAEERLLGGNPDFVLDAIDNLDTKVSR